MIGWALVSDARWGACSSGQAGGDSACVPLACPAALSLEWNLAGGPPLLVDRGGPVAKLLNPLRGGDLSHPVWHSAGNPPARTLRCPRQIYHRAAPDPGGLGGDLGWARWADEAQQNMPVASCGWSDTWALLRFLLPGGDNLLLRI